MTATVMLIVHPDVGVFLAERYRQRIQALYGPSVNVALTVSPLKDAMTSTDDLDAAMAAAERYSAA